MSVYSSRGKGWRYDFVLRKKRYSGAGFKTKREAAKAEAKRKEELESGVYRAQAIDMVFLDLVNLRLDHVKAFNSPRHYKEYVYCARRWVKEWGNLLCSEITEEMLMSFLLKRRKVSAYTANKEIRYLRAAFNFGLKKKHCLANPLDGMDFFPVDKTLKRIPSREDIDRVMAVAEPHEQDYLWLIHDTLARINEINALTWDDVDLEFRYLVLYTRKKKGGHRTPRKVPMTSRVHAILRRKSAERKQDVPWVFWHAYRHTKHESGHVGPYQYRKTLMAKLCERAGVEPFGFHDLRHAGASLLDSSNVPVGTIQRLLGHENRTTTEIYLHSVGESEREAMEVFERVGLASKVPHQVPHQEKRGHCLLQ